MIGWLIGLGLATGGLSSQADSQDDLVVKVPLNADGEVDVAMVVNRLADATETKLERLKLAVAVELPTLGRSRPLTVQYLTDALRPDVRVELDPQFVSFHAGPDPSNRKGGPDWERRLVDLATKTRGEADRQGRYGFRGRPSYRPNDPTRPTICLIHGLNSTAAVFKHLAPALEAAGYGVVTYDFPYNRDLDKTSAEFGRDWSTFRRQNGETGRWVILAHSMGALLARSYVESAKDDDPPDVSALLMIAPPNHGSDLAHGQTFLQAVQALQSVRGERRAGPLAYLGDGLGAAADDLSPGSAYLNGLNARPRRSGVLYRILAGDSAYLNLQSRRQVESRLSAAGRIGGLGKLLADGLGGPLDEITDGLGDGCVSVASARLDGVPDRVIHANHLELIRAPLLFPGPGPIASMPILLEWLKDVGDPKRVER